MGEQLVAASTSGEVVKLTLDGGTGQFSPSHLYNADSMITVEVYVQGQAVPVEIDPEAGPKLLKLDGSPGGLNDTLQMGGLGTKPGLSGALRGVYGVSQRKSWKTMTSTERNIAVITAAKKNFHRLQNKAIGMQLHESASDFPRLGW
eukprot:TRINITY_DN16545_c2_g7_i1.p1 TRINITY_DN16545_c2_g7~~TRINITY_DN16545_c2_g7_i1.p1  ORF type:complete len:147 (+),score=32.48 TRINITY_DN16545_c2_g7_i1:126-566(+)